MRNDLTERYQITKIQEAVNARNGKKIKLRWSTPAEVRRSLSKINNMLANHEILPKEANSIIAAANLILRALELELEERKAASVKF